MRKRFDEHKIRHGDRLLRDNIVKGAAQIKGGPKWASWRWTVNAVFFVVENSPLTNT